MAIQLSVAVRNARLDAIEGVSGVGTSAILKIREGAQPASCASTDTGLVLATINLASDWMSNAASGSKAMSGLPVSDLTADNNGTAGHFRIYDSTGATCHIQGSISLPAGTGDMKLDNTSIAVNQQVNITSFNLTDANA